MENGIYLWMVDFLWELHPYKLKMAMETMEDAGSVWNIFRWKRMNKTYIMSLCCQGCMNSTRMVDGVFFFEIWAIDWHICRVDVLSDRRVHNHQAHYCTTWWLNHPVEKYACPNGNLPQGSGWKFKKHTYIYIYIWNRHLAYQLPFVLTGCSRNWTTSFQMDNYH